MMSAGNARALLAGICLALAALPTLAQDKPREALRVCQDPNNLPFSNTKGEGIENHIAELFGKALGLPVTYYSFPQRLAFIRNTLRYKLPGEDYPCDIVMGVPLGFDQVSVTKPTTARPTRLCSRRARAWMRSRPARTSSSWIRRSWPRCASAFTTARRRPTGWRGIS